jgi:hypothetical protein
MQLGLVQKLVTLWLGLGFIILVYLNIFFDWNRYTMIHVGTVSSFQFSDVLSFDMLSPQPTR